MASKRSDVIGGLLSVGLGLCLIFWLIPEWVEPDPDLRLPVSFVPRIVAIGFIICGTALLFRQFVSHQQPAIPAESKSNFTEFKGLGLMLVILLVSTLGFQWFHFLVVAPILIAVTMWFFGPLRPLSLVLTASVGPALIWVIATHVLGRTVP